MFLYVVKLIQFIVYEKARMSFFLCNAKVNSNYCVGDKDK